MECTYRGWKGQRVVKSVAEIIILEPILEWQKEYYIHWKKVIPKLGKTIEQMV